MQSSNSNSAWRNFIQWKSKIRDFKFNLKDVMHINSYGNTVSYSRTRNKSTQEGDQNANLVMN